MTPESWSDVSDNLKNIAESIAAVREELATHDSNQCTGGTAEAHLDILLTQIADELRRAHRGAASAQALAALMERESS